MSPGFAEDCPCPCSDIEVECCGEVPRTLHANVSGGSCVGSFNVELEYDEEHGWWIGSLNTSCERPTYVLLRCSSEGLVNPAWNVSIYCPPEYRPEVTEWPGGQGAPAQCDPFLIEFDYTPDSVIASCEDTTYLHHVVITA